MPTKIWVELIISGFPMPHEELTQILGIQPTEAENKGDLYHSPSGKSFVLTHSSWTLSSGLNPAEIGIEGQTEAILEKISPFKNEFKSVTEKYSSTINIVIHSSSLSTPYIGWESSMIKELAELNLSIGIDLSIEDE